MAQYSQQVPSAVASFQRRYSQLLPYFQTNPELLPLFQLDYNRAIRGAYPVPENRIPNILSAVRTGQTNYQQSPPKGPSYIPSFLRAPVSAVERVGEDAAQLARSLPQLPAQFAKEVTQLPQAPAQIAKALESKDKLDIFKAPGLRLLPGAYVASEGLHTFAEHPLFAALDVAPYAKVLGAPLAEAAAGIMPESTKVAFNELRQLNPVGPVARETSRIYAESRRTAAAKLTQLAEQTGLSADQLPKKVVSLQKGIARRERRAALGDAYGISRSDLEAKLLPLAEARAGRYGSTEAAMNKLIDSNYAEWGKMQGPPREVAPGVYEQEQRYVPKQVKQVHDTYELSKMNPANGPWQKAMGVYRTSILPLSPRWNINNVISGGVLTAAKTGPSALKYIRDAWHMARTGEIPEGISSGWGSLPREAQDEIAARGALLKRIMPQKLIEAAWGANGFVDNFYRSIGYLYGKDKALTGRGLRATQKEADRLGVTVEKLAEKKGINLANSVLQDWDALVPFERSVIKTIFPFYGWIHHIMKFVAKYPIDNPIRAAIFDNFARNEINDWKTGLPQDFQNYFYLGPDSRGNEKGLNLRGMNPFSDTDTLFNAAGFIQQMNPVAAGLGHALGLNAITGRPDLYQDVAYDENSGRLVANTPSTPAAAVQIAEGFVPQFEGLRRMLGWLSPDEKASAQASPEGATNRIYSAFGLPYLRTVNKPLEIAKAEYRRGEVMLAALNKGVRTGDFSEASRYPQLKETVAALKRAAKSGAISQYQVRPTPTGQADPVRLWQELFGAGG